MIDHRNPNLPQSPAAAGTSRPSARAAARPAMEARACAAVLLATLAASASAEARAEAVTRQDLTVRTSDGHAIAVREVRASSASNGAPIILVHGARVPGIASFDLPVPGGSLAEDLANAGHVVYVIDARGYGRSSRPKEMDGPASAHPPLVRAWEVMRDLAAVSREARQRSGVERIVLIGWATGAMWSGMYAALNPDEVSHLVYSNGLYGGSSDHRVLGIGTPNEDPSRPGVFNMRGAGAYRLSNAADLLRPWDGSIPVEDKSAWRDQAVADEYVKQALASDPESGARSPPAFRAPSGAMEDSFYQATGRQLFDASTITARVLVLRSERDFWSRPQDAETLARHLSRAKAVVVETIPNATHHVHLDRAERGREHFLRRVTEFLGARD